MQNLSSIFLPNKEITCEEYPVNLNNIASVVEQYGGQIIDDLVLLQDQLRILYPTLTLSSATTNELSTCRTMARSKYL